MVGTVKVTDFKLKTYRCEWQVQNGEVDQYGLNFKPYETFSYATHEEAFAARPNHAKLHGFVKGRWIPKNAPHDYVECQIAYEEVEVK